MAIIQWRKFPFFSQRELSENCFSDNDQGASVNLVNVTITACTSGRGYIVVGDAEGMIHVVNRNGEASSFPAYDLCVTHLHQSKHHNIMISVGEDSNKEFAVLKIWNSDKLDKDGFPTCSRPMNISHNGKPVAVATIATLDNLSQIAIGLVNGTVLLVRGDLSRDRYTRQKVIHEDIHPVTGLGFYRDSTNLFITTSAAVFLYNAKEDTKDMLHNQGCELGCFDMSDPEQDGSMILGRREAVYFYGIEGRTSCCAFDGPKAKLHWFRNYLLVVGKSSAAGNAAAQKLTLGGMNKNGERDVNSITIYDIKNRFIAFSAVLSDVIDVVSEWGSVFIICSQRTNSFIQLEEKDTQTKLDILFKKNLYPLAISLANSQHYDYDSIIEICTQYGDHLYNKRDFDNAMAQYVRTIGYLEPSYVIRKFLDAQRIHNLTYYLQTLHAKNLANSNHTTLLLNCYTKLKDVQKLDEFIISNKEKTFDVETAIKVCRQAGYWKHALYLSKKFSQHAYYIKIQLEDVHNYTDVLDYIWTLDFIDAETYMGEYGKTLVNNLPEETTKLLMELCTDYVPKSMVTDNVAPAGHTNNDEIKSSSKALSPSFDFHSFMESLKLPNFKKEDFEPANITMSSNIGEEKKPQTASVVRSSAERFIHLFADQIGWLCVFLEYIVDNLPPDCVDSRVFNTLLELYLRPEESADAAEKQKQKALALLDNEAANYDLDHAMVLCQMYDFCPGILYLYEKAGEYQQIIQYYMQKDDYENIAISCKRYGRRDSQLWVQALSYFASNERNCTKYIAEVLGYIEKFNLLPPLMVIEILSQTSTASLGLIKDYISRKLQEEEQNIEEDNRMIDLNKAETEKLRKEIQDLKTEPVIFQKTKCSLCTSPLDLPSVHFLCMHSFHQRCLGDNEGVCVICQQENRKIMDIVKAQEDNAAHHESFFKHLEGSEDGFAVIADYFGKGVFNKLTLVSDGQGMNAHNYISTGENRQTLLSNRATAGL
eukprot:Nk52_evm50s207 gene=Nk52_evmTU50s207